MFKIFILKKNQTPPICMLLLKAIRNVPINKTILGEIALNCLPNIYQLYIQSTDKVFYEEKFETNLYQARKLIEEIYLDDEQLYFCSLSSKTIIWNGPMGVFEFSHFSKGTLSVGKSICESTEKGAFSLVGGGDSIAAIKKFNLANGISYISTGGGAMLEYLEGKELPALKALL